jgi:SAM-dependent MidA family methyltransferase
MTTGEQSPHQSDPSPERLDRFMARANAIYYATRDPFADFTTAPEISQVFGEIVGLWAAVTWQLLGSPTPIALVEAGPGRGTLMADACRAIRRAAPDVAAALNVHLIETSPRLRAAQASRLPGATWHDDLDSVPAIPIILLANEFLDALPIRQFVRRGGGWNSRPALMRCPRAGQRPRVMSSRSTNRRVTLSPPLQNVLRNVLERRCFWTTDRNTARRATACKRWRGSDRSIRWRMGGPPT